MSRSLQLENILNSLKSLSPEEQYHEFCSLLYTKRERLVGSTDFSDVEFYLVNLNLNLDLPTHRGYPLLFEAVDNYAPAVVDFLLRNGVDTNIVWNGNTPLEFAKGVLQDISWRPAFVPFAQQSVDLLSALS